MLDDDAIRGNVLEGDVLVGDAGNGASGTGDGLDADTVLRVGDGGGENADRLDDVVGAAADRADGETVAAGATSAGEGDAGARVDSKAIVLVGAITKLALLCKTMPGSTHTLAPEMVTPVEDPTSKASVLCPREAPAELS